VASFDQERTKKRALARLVDIVTDQLEAGTDPHLSVMHIDAKEDAEALEGMIRSRVELPHIPIYTLPAAIGVHAGPKALAVGFFV
jgi:fatty acid-binding protein DegV